MMKRVLAGLLCVVMLLGLLPTAAFAADPENWVTEATEPAGYVADDTEITISSAAELAWVAQQVKDDITDFEDVTITLAGDIALSDYQWTPIGCDTEHAFKGTFDGAGHTVSGLTIDATAGGYYGLFGAVTGEVKNVNVAGSVAVNTTDDEAKVGGIVGYCNDENAIVDNCQFTGTISGTAGRTASVGGAVGENGGGKITSCSVTIGDDGIQSSAPNAYAGGVVGYNNGQNFKAASVLNCYAVGTGVVKTTTAASNSGSAGGVVGSNYMSQSLVKNSYATVNVEGSSTSVKVGGIVGYNGGQIANSYAAGAVSGAGLNVGGAVGLNDTNDNDGKGTIADCYWKSGATDPATTVGVGTDDDSNTTATAFVGTGSVNGGKDLVYQLNDWVEGDHEGDESFYKAWLVNDSVNSGYPYHVSNWIDLAAKPADDGEDDDTITITNAKELAWLAKQVNDDITDFEDVTITLAGDIDLAGYQWTPIGTFAGTFDGAGHTISNMTIDMDTGTDDCHAGLFRIVDNMGKVKNLGVVDVDITASSSDRAVKAGGVAGTMETEAAVENCYVTGSVAVSGGAQNRAGGVVGSVIGGATVKNCYAKVDVSASREDASVGGVVGYNGATVEDCYYSADATQTVNGAAQTPKGVGNDSDTTVPTVYFGGKGYISTDETDLMTRLNTWVAGKNISEKLYKIWVADGNVNDGYPSHSSVPKNWIDLAEEPDGYTDGATAITITTPEELAWVAREMNGGITTFKNVTITLAGDIDLAGAQWTPIGIEKTYDTRDTHAFLGTFDGAGHAVSGLTYSGDLPYVGLFGYMGKASTVKNLTVELGAGGLTSDGAGQSAYIGGVAGCNEVGTVDNCHVTGTGTVTVTNAKGTYGYAGGVVGYNHGGLVTNSSATVDVTTSEVENGVAGGVVAWNDIESATYPAKQSIATVANCYATGDVSVGVIPEGAGTYSKVGGVVGWSKLNSKVVNCYATGAVSSTATDVKIGGVAGYLHTTNSTITDCYWKSDATDPATTVGVGTDNGTGTTVTAFTGTGALASAVTVGDSAETSDLKTALHNWVKASDAAAGFLGWYALAGTNGGYPYHVGGWADIVASMDSAPAGYVVNGNNITISTAEGLAWLAKQNDTFSGKTITLGADIDLGGYLWTPIGEFKGTFDGAGHTISNMTVYVDVANFGYAGLFTVVGEDGVVRNLGIVGANITASSSDKAVKAGGVASAIEQGAIVENCYVTGSVEVSNSTANYIGGVVGQIASGATVKNCYAKVNISASGTDTNVGGVVGAVDNLSTITNCYWSGNATKGIGSGTDTDTTVAFSGTGTLTSAVTVGDSAETSDLKTALHNWVDAKNVADYYDWKQDTDELPAFDGAWVPNVAMIGETGYTTLQKAVDAAGTDKQPGIDIVLRMDIEQTETLTINKEVTLNLKGFDIKAKEAGISVITLGAGADLTLKDSTVSTDTVRTRYGYWDGDTYTIVDSRVADTDTELKGGVIYGGTGTSWAGATCGGGVFAVAANGTVIFTMESGTIAGNKADGGGGGVHVAENGTFTMSSTAKIIDNKAGSGGGVCISTSATAATISGGTITGNTCEGDGANVFTESTLNLSGVPVIENIYLSGGTIAVGDNAYTGKPIPVIIGARYAEDDDVTVATGTTVDATKFPSFQWYTTVVETGVIKFSYAAPESPRDYTIDGDNYTIKTALGLNWLAGQVNSGTNYFKSKTVTLVADIDLTNRIWKPIGTFKGTFDGAGHTISNMTIYVDVVGNCYAGLFTVVGEGGVVKNLGVVNAYITASSSDKAVRAGGVAGAVESGTVENCYVTGDVTISGSTANYAGGVVGQIASGATVKNCYAKVNISASGDSVYAGGVVGNASDPVTNCYWSGNATKGIGAGTGTNVVAFTDYGTIGENTAGLVEALDSWALEENSLAYYRWTQDVDCYPTFTSTHYAVTDKDGNEITDTDTVEETVQALIIKVAGTYHIAMGDVETSGKPVVVSDEGVKDDVTLVFDNVNIVAAKEANYALKGNECKLTIQGTLTAYGEKGAISAEIEPTLTGMEIKASADGETYDQAVTWGSDRYTYGDSATPALYVQIAKVTVSPAPATYGSTLAKCENGSATLSSTKATLNSTVTVTVKADEGYEVAGVTVAHASGKAVGVTDNGNGTYSYKQPGASVTVTVTFETIEKEWFEEAKTWAEEKAIVTEDFVQDDICTRADAVTFIWKAMGCPEATGENPFVDMGEGDAYYTAALWAYEAGITTGTEDGATFSGDWECTRSQIVTLLWRNAGMSSAEIDNAFDDVTEGAWDYAAIQWAVEKAITEGTGNNLFSGINDCTQMEIVTFLFRQVAA